MWVVDPFALRPLRAILQHKVCCKHLCEIQGWFCVIHAYSALALWATGLTSLELCGYSTRLGLIYGDRRF
jgi:hypothetical protein